MLLNPESTDRPKLFFLSLVVFQEVVVVWVLFKQKMMLEPTCLGTGEKRGHL